MAGEAAERALHNKQGIEDKEHSNNPLVAEAVEPHFAKYAYDCGDGEGVDVDVDVDVDA